MTTITRTEYNPEGTESVLGLPAVTVSQDFDGSINQGALSIEDAAEIEHISINDNNSANILSLVAKIADVKLQGRQVLTDITKPIVTGVPIDTEGNADYSVEPTEVELTEVVLSEPVTVDGIPVAKAWRAATDKSFMQIKSVAITDGLPLYNATCIYRILSKEQAADIARVIGVDVSDGIQIDIDNGMLDRQYNITSTGNYVIAIIARNDITTFCYVVSVSLGISDYPIWIKKAYSELGEIAFSLIKFYNEFSDIQYTFTKEKRQVISGGGFLSEIASNIEYTIDIDCCPVTMSGENLIFTALGRTSYYKNKIFWDFGNRDSAYRIWTDEVFTKNTWYSLRYHWFTVRYIQDINSEQILVESANVPYSDPTKLIGFGGAVTKLSTIKIYDGTMSIVYFFVPFIRDSQAGFLNILTGEFFSNSANIYTLEEI